MGVLNEKKKNLHDERERLMRESSASASPMAKQKALTKDITISKFTDHADAKK